MTTTFSRYKLVFFVPPPALSACKSAIFSAGAGRFPGSGGYTECCFTSKGLGQFRPGDVAKPNVFIRLHVTGDEAEISWQIGKIGKLEEVEEYRVEAMCVDRETTVRAVDALKKAHPYEEPAYEVYKMEDM